MDKNRILTLAGGGAQTDLMENNLAKATFAAGCFWGVEAEFRQINGVIATRVGYTGGTLANPNYDDVRTGSSGHAEAVEMKFDLQVVSFNDLLNVFQQIHDPTTKDRQGPDIGTQYRSAIFYHAPQQKEAAQTAIKTLTAKGKFMRPIVTEIAPAGVFYPAEDYHQQYPEKRGHTACRIKPRLP